MDRTKWHGHGPQFSRGGRLWSYLVRTRFDAPTSRLPALTLFRDFVAEAQARLGGFTGAGGSPLSWSFQAAYRPLQYGPPGGADTYERIDDSLTDEIVESIPPVMLPPPELANLPDIENMMRAANTTAAGRDALTKFIVGADFIKKIVPLVEMAEELESLTDLHRLCNIMKTIILLNDSAIIEHVVKDDVCLGVVGALECKNLATRLDGC